MHQSVVPMSRSARNRVFVLSDFGSWQVINCASDRARLCLLVLGNRFFSVKDNHWYGVTVNGSCECPKSFLAHSNFGIGYLGNYAMHVFSEHGY